MERPRPAMSAPMTATPKVPPTIRLMERMPEATPALAGSTLFMAAVRHGRHDEAHAEAHQDEGADEEAEARRRGQVPLPEQRRGHRHQAGGHQRPRADPVRQAPGDRPDDDDHDGRGQEAHAGLQRRVALDVLQVQGEEEEHRQHREGDDEGDEVRAQERPRAEEREVDHRLGAAALDEHEARRAPTAATARRARMRPEPQPQALPSTSASTSADEADGDRGHAAVVDDVRRALVARLVRGPQRHHDGRGGDGQVEEEDRLPGDVLDQEAADDRADGERERAHAGPGPDRLAALRGRERVGDDRQRARAS